MSKKVMERSAADNVYFHRDFHGSMNTGIAYLREKYGEESVREYLRQFTGAYFAPLKQALKQRGLIALKEHFEKIFKIEGASAHISLNKDELRIELEENPAVLHLHKLKMAVDPLFYETTKTVCEALCEGSGFTVEYTPTDAENGGFIERFYRRDAR